MSLEDCTDIESHKHEYDADYDAHYCTDCNIWLEKACGDPDCHYCKDRPETPCKS